MRCGTASIHHQESSHPPVDRRLSSNSKELPNTRLRVQAALESLRHQYSALVKSLPVIPTLDTNVSSSHTQSLPATVEEDDDDVDTPSTYKSASQSTRRISTGFSCSEDEDSSLWFDAPDGAEEFVLDPSSKDEDTEPQPSELDSHIISRTDSASLSLSDSESHLIADSSSFVDAEGDDSVLRSPDIAPVIRRTDLPSPVIGDEGSILSVLRKNVGKVGYTCNICRELDS